MADGGLQPERTLLSWQRLCLAFAVASAVYVRLGVHHLGRASIAIGCGGVIVAIIAYVAVWRRYRFAREGLDKDTGVGDGLHLFVAWVAVTLLGVAVAAFVAVSELR